MNLFRDPGTGGVEGVDVPSYDRFTPKAWCPLPRQFRSESLASKRREGSGRDRDGSTEGPVPGHQIGRPEYWRGGLSVDVNLDN